MKTRAFKCNDCGQKCMVFVNGDGDESPKRCPFYNGSGKWQPVSKDSDQKLEIRNQKGSA